ncbi:MAG: hypothetical protein JST75_16645 [Bacteroidetes bacterium]|nr:hypothetical protein [Bacteroidota bacterium]
MKYVKYRVTEKKSSDLDNWPELYNNHLINNFMNEQENMEARLWEYIDGLTTEAEKSAIEKLIETNLEWQRTYRELLEAHKLITSTELESPSMRFTKNVMEDIAKYHVAPATSSYINKKIIWGVAAFFIVMIVGFVIYSFGQLTWANSSSSSIISPKLEKLNWGKFLNNSYTNIFVMINVILGLMLLDMYLTRKKKLLR